MELPLSRRAFVWLDRATKLLGLVAVAVAFEGSAGPLSVPVGLAGVLVGTATIACEPADAEPLASEPAPDRDYDGYLDRFHNPRIALVATVGAAIWLCSFLVAGTGVVLRSSNSRVAVTLFALSGPLGLVGVAVVAVAAAWLGVRRFGPA